MVLFKTYVHFLVCMMCFLQAVQSSADQEQLLAPNIYTARSHTAIPYHQLEKDDVLVVDLDETVWTTVSQLCNPERERTYSPLLEEIRQTYHPDLSSAGFWHTIDIFNNIFFGYQVEDGHYKLMEPEIPNLLAELKTRGVKVLAITGLSISDQKRHFLQATGLDKILVENETLIVSGDKSHALATYMYQHNIPYNRKIFFIDNLRPTLQSVQQYTGGQVPAPSLFPNFYGFEYTKHKDDVVARGKIIDQLFQFLDSLGGEIFNDERRCIIKMEIPLFLNEVPFTIRIDDSAQIFKVPNLQGLPWHCEAGNVLFVNNDLVKECEEYFSILGRRGVKIFRFTSNPEKNIGPIVQRALQEQQVTRFRKLFVVDFDERLLVNTLSSLPNSTIRFGLQTPIPQTLISAMSAVTLAS